ncbi:MAG: hypothetical protein U0401_03460 [Anaerolineae bacterium]
MVYGGQGRLGFTREQARRKFSESLAPAKPQPGFLQEVILVSKESQALAKEEEVLYAAELLAQVIPDDLLGYGLIPEFVGRLPVIVTVEPLGHAALMKILTEPKNAVHKQFQHLFTLDNAELVFTQEALSTAAARPLKIPNRRARPAGHHRRSFAGCNVRAKPSRKDIRKCIINAAVIRGEAKPEMYDELGLPIGVALDKAA